MHCCTCTPGRASVEHFATCLRPLPSSPKRRRPPNPHRPGFVRAMWAVDMNFVEHCAWVCCICALLGHSGTCAVAVELPSPLRGPDNAAPAVCVCILHGSPLGGGGGRRGGRSGV